MSQQIDVGTDAAATARKAVRAQVAFGAVFVCIGLGMIAMVHVDPSGLNAPYWVVIAAMLTFVVAGLSVIARALGRERLAEAIALLVVFGLAAPGLWILFDPLEKSCSATSGFFTREAGDLECRLVFGIGGGITLLVGFVAVAMFVRRLLRRHRTVTSQPADPAAR